MNAFDDDVDPDISEPGEIPAAPRSGLAAIRGKRAEAVKALHIDLPVQRSEEVFGQTVFVRCRPYTDAERKAVTKRVEKLKSKADEVAENASLLAKCTLGIFTADERDNPDEWMRFDRELAALILDEDESEVSVATAAEVVRLLYLTDGDILSSAAKLTEFSGYSLEELDEATSGN